MSCSKVIVIIANWNGKDVLKPCLESLNELKYKNYEIVVVDNGSSDGSQQTVLHEFPSIHLITNQNNKGFAAAQNSGIAYAINRQADYVFALNNDVIVDENVLDALVSTVESDKSIGAAAPTVYDAQQRAVVQSAGGMLDWKRARAYQLNSGKSSAELPRVSEIDYYGQILIRSDVLKQVGFFNTKYFMYWEDAELCTRIKQAGYKIVSVSNAKIWHRHAYSSRSVKAIDFYGVRNRFWFMKEYNNVQRWTTILIRFFLSDFWVSVLSYLYHRDVRGLLVFCTGVIEGIKISHSARPI